MASDVWKRCRGDGPDNDVPSAITCLSRVTPEVEGIQVTKLNRIAVISWIASRGGRASIARDAVAILGAVTRLAYVTDWVIRYPMGEFCVVPQRMFRMIHDTDQPLSQKQGK